MDSSGLVKHDTDGKYCILFQNRHSLELEEIEEIFSQFGKVCRIQCTGDLRGYRFIRYRHYDEVEKAIEGLKNHPKIKLAEHRSKNKNNPENQSNNKEKNSNSNFDDKKQFKYQKNDKNNYQNNNGKNNWYDKNSKSKLHNEKSNDQQVNKEKNLPELLFNDRTSITSENSSIHSKLSYVQEHLKKRRNNERQNSHSFSSLNSGVKYTNRSDSMKNKCLDDYQEDNLPNLVESTKAIDTENSLRRFRKTIVNAEEIIVGNIHPNFGACYILHLFDLFEPIAISDIKIIPKTGNRYCHVYFKSLQDSLGVETQFDNYDLSGKKLVVLRPCRLMEEGML